MKKFLLLLLVLGILLPSSWASDGATGNSDYTILKVGSLSVRQLKNVYDRTFFLNDIIYPRQRRTVNVPAFVFEWPFFSPFHLDRSHLTTSPIYKQAYLEVYDYLPEAYNLWRVAANKYLPAQYQLPNLTFVLSDGHVNKGAPLYLKGPQRKASGISLEVYATYQNMEHISLGAKNVLGVGVPYFKPSESDFGRIGFRMYGEWFDWLVAREKVKEAQNKSSEEQEKAKEALENATKDYAERIISEGAGVIYANYESAAKKNPKLAETLKGMPPEQWHKTGPWAARNQAIFTHEFGHLFGLPHEDDKTSVMYSELDSYASVFTKPNEADGLRLATMVCWYQNERLKKLRAKNPHLKAQNCVPITEATAKQEENKKKVTEEVANSLRDKVLVQKEQEKQAEKVSPVSEKTTNQGKSPATAGVPVISGNYVGPTGAQVVAATSKPKVSAPVATPKPNTPAPVVASKPQQPVAAPVSQSVKVDNSPKAALDRYIASHPNLRDSLLAVRTGTALPTQAREVQEYQTLFDAYKNGNATPAKAEAKTPKADNKANNAAKRKELEDKYKAQCTLSSFEQKYEKELTPIRKRLAKGQKLNQRQASLWSAYSQRLKQVQSTPRCQNLSAQIKAL